MLAGAVNVGEPITTPYTSKLLAELSHKLDLMLKLADLIRNVTFWAINETAADLRQC